MSSKPLIYLASPYSHPDPSVRQERYEAACKATAAMMRQGYHVYSPIAATHPPANYGLTIRQRYGLGKSS